MTMLREFFDITVDSAEIFKGLAIMDTEYASHLNSRPVIYFTFKDCKADTIESLLFKIGSVLLGEYAKYQQVFNGSVDESKVCFSTFNLIYSKLVKHEIGRDFIELSVVALEQAVYEYYKVKPILLIDEYDQPMMSSFEHGYNSKLKDFFAGFYGSALKGQDSLHQALLTGIQRIAKESVFSQLNNIKVYTVLDKRYSEYFGLTHDETQELLMCYGLALDDDVKRKYDGYVFGETEMYNPWSLLYYAETSVLKNYWINTSSNYLIHESIRGADSLFREDFEKLISEGKARVVANLEVSFTELGHRYTLWGLLINTGYLTVDGHADGFYYDVRIPNGEVRSEFAWILADQGNFRGEVLHDMFRRLMDRDMEGFMMIYSDLVISCTSYYDAKENAYHMLFLGMCITLIDLYKITSNIESGHGRSDITMESLSVDRLHIIIEFKQGEDIEGLKDEALRQILDNRYYSGLSGEVLCIGLAHDKKRCAIAHETVAN